MTLARALVDDVSGLPFEGYLARNFWSPLGMRRTCITVPPELAGDVATGYRNTRLPSQRLIRSLSA